MTDAASAPAASASPARDAEPAVGQPGPVAGPVGVPAGGDPMEAALRALPLEALHDVELHVEVVLGRARMPLRDLLAAHPGTTIELDRSVHSTVDVMVNGTLFARGEMVVVDDSEIGVQISEVIGVDMTRDGRS